MLKINWREVKAGWRIFARVIGRPAVKRADLQGRQNDAVSIGYKYPFKIFLFDFSISFFFWLSRERGSPSLSSVRFPASSSVVEVRREPPSPVVFRRANGVDRQIGTLWFWICGSVCLKVFQKQRIWVFRFGLKKKQKYFVFYFLFLVCFSVWMCLFVLGGWERCSKVGFRVFVVSRVRV